MNDLISRQAAIDGIKKEMLERDGRFYKGLLVANHVILHLPSAQPERPEQPESAKEYCAECNHIEMCRWYPYEGCEFRSLPSAQPTQTNADSTHENTLDCVSRQQAIDGIKNEILKGDRRFYKGLLVANHVIVQLPPAQAERKKGKWINHRNDDGHNIADCDQCGNAIQWFDGDEVPRYCCMCGTDMRTEGNDDN